MVHIGYFLLLLFCISTNMTHGMGDFMDLTQNELNLQIQEGAYDSWKWDSINFNETSDSFNFSLDSMETFSGSDDTSSESEFSDRECFITFEERFSSSLSNLPKKSSSSLDVFSGKSFTANRSSCPQEQPEASNLSISSSSARQFLLPSENANDFMDLTQQTFDFGIDKNIDVLSQISSHSKQQKNINCHSQKPSTENFETALQQSVSQSILSIDLQLSYRTESPMSSDVEDSTVQLSSKQPPRKKRRVNKEDVPDDAYFTIVCDYCFHKQQFKATHKHNLIQKFKIHLEDKHSDITKEEKQTYIGQHLRQPGQLVNFLVRCPESGCKHIADSVYRRNLKTSLFSHISKKHQKNKGNYSIKSLATYVEDNCEKTLVLAQKQLKNGNFTIVCDYCSLKPQFRTQIKGNLITNFKRHLKRKHQSITEDQAKIYINKHLQQPEQFVKFSVHCPKSECEYIACDKQRSKLKTHLFNHVFVKHSENKGSYSKESVAMYVDVNCKQAFVPEQFNKKYVPDNAYFTIFCIGCLRQFRSLIKKYIIQGFKNHLKRKHQNITEDQAKIYISEHLRQPELLIRFSVHCPESECKHIAYTSSQRSELKSLFDHISIKHPKKKDNYSKASVETYVEKNYTTAFVKQFNKKGVPATRKIKKRKKKEEFLQQLKADSLSISSSSRTGQSFLPTKNTNYHSRQSSVESFETEPQQLVSQSLLPISLQLSNRIESSMSSDTEDKTVQPSSKQRPRKKRRTNKKDVPDSAYFSIFCCFCSPKLQFKTILRYNLINNFKKHLRNVHLNITEGQAQIYINEHLQEAEQLVKFSINCPESECKHIASSVQQSNLKKNLLDHISTQHQKNKDNYSIESLGIYVEENCKQILVPIQEQLKKTKRKRTDIAEQQSTRQSPPAIALQPSNKVEPSISSDVEKSTIFDQTNLVSEQVSSKRLPRKKRRLDVPDNAYFRITCRFCRKGLPFQTYIKSNLIKGFKKHLKQKHQNITEEKIKIYIKQHLKKPELFVKFSVRCPESDCEHIVCAGNKFNLKNSLLNHIFKREKHRKVKKNYSEELLVKYISQNREQEFVPEQLKKGVSDSICFTITCSYCPDNPEFNSVDKLYLVNSFNKHMKIRHQNITEEEAKIYINQHLKEPKLLAKFSVRCPEPDCEHIVCLGKKSNLKRSLFIHMSNEHKKEIGYSGDKLSAYVAGNCEKTFVPAQKQLKSTKKNKN